MSGAVTSVASIVGGAILSKILAPKPPKVASGPSGAELEAERKAADIEAQRKTLLSTSAAKGRQSTIKSLQQVTESQSVGTNTLLGG